MKTRDIKVGNEVKDVSLLGFGCMRFPMKDGEVDTVLSKKMIDYAISKGVNYIDTAWPYHGGKSEPFVGKFLKENNNQMKNGILYLKGGDLREEMAGIKGHIRYTNISDFYSEEFFETKKVVYLH